MEQFQKKDEIATVGKKEEPLKTSAPKGNSGEKKDNPEQPRRSFWHRLKNFTFEAPKKVIYEGNTVRLVPIAPEVPKIAKPVIPVAVTPEPVAIAPKPPVKVEERKPVAAPPKPPVVKAEKEKPPTVTPEPVVEKKEPVVVAPEPVVVEKIAEKKVVPAPVPEERLKKGMEKTRGRFWSRLKNFFSLTKKIDEPTIEELEDILIGADVGVKPVQKLIQEIHEAWEAKTITETSHINDFIKGRLKDGLASWKIDLQYAAAPPTVIMVVGVNGVGKTTSIAKLANLLRKDGKKVMVAASDTFRAAAVEQLEIWSKRIGVEIVKHKTGADPAAVAYDALEASIARGTDVLIVDTAGRLHTHENLMNELSKIKRVISKRIPDAPHEVLMVLDATTGQNSISQAKMFKQAVDVTGIFLAKLDGTAKGGIVLGMGSEINIPVKFIGLGETADDIERFNPGAFVDTLFEA